MCKFWQKIYKKIQSLLKTKAEETHMSNFFQQNKAHKPTQTQKTEIYCILYVHSLQNSGVQRRVD